jgi:hypothetical protein
MADALHRAGFAVVATDIAAGCDFFAYTATHGFPRTVVTNPPFSKSRQFIEHALSLADTVAMLLRIDYDSAVTRRHLFGDCGAFARKIDLLHRIVWFADSRGRPSDNHAWYLWNRAHRGPPALAYA